MLKIVITGTSQGIGLEFSKQLLRDGHELLAIARASSHLQELHALRDKFPKQLTLVEADLKSSEVYNQVEKMLTHWSHVDVLINNAGIYTEDNTPEAFAESFHVNSIVPYFMTKALLPKLKVSSQPRVIFISSQMGSIADNHSGGSYAYRSSKSAVNMIGKGFAVDEKWLTSLIFHPGWVQTRMGGSNAPTAAKEAVAGMLKILYEADKTLSGRYLTYQGQSLAW